MQGSGKYPGFEVVRMRLRHIRTIGEAVLYGDYFTRALWASLSTFSTSAALSAGSSYTSSEAMMA